MLNDVFPPTFDVTPERCLLISHAVVDTLVELHQIQALEDFGEFGHPKGFLARQINGWISRYKWAKTGEVAGVERVMTWLTEHLPPSMPATLIHNDYKLNNILLDTATLCHPVAVVDWEMASVGIRSWISP